MPSRAVRPPCRAAGGAGPGRSGVAAVDPAALERGVRSGDRRAVARAITLVESSRSDHQPAAAELLERLAGARDHARSHALRIGLSGPPGVGKSTFIESLGTFLVDRGHKVAVLAVDPSSAVSGGSILGDKTRMERLAHSPRAFIRPTPSGAARGGVARRTPETIRIVEAAGFDVVIVETVGAGQSEAAVAAMTDIFVLLLAPGTGDELQGIKRGIVELAHLVLVNKADGDLAEAAGRTAAEYRNAFRLLAGSGAGWRVEVHTCSALTGAGIAEAWDCIERYRHWYERTGTRPRRRSEQARGWLWSEVADGVRAAIESREDLRRRVESLEGDVAAGRMPAAAAARRVIEAVFGEPAGSRRTHGEEGGRTARNRTAPEAAREGGGRVASDA